MSSKKLPPTRNQSSSKKISPSRKHSSKKSGFSYGKNKESSENDKIESEESWMSEGRKRDVRRRKAKHDIMQKKGQELKADKSNAKKMMKQSGARGLL